MAFGTAGDDAQAALDEGLGQHLGVLDDLFLVGLEFGRQGFLEGHGLAGDDMHQRAALDAGEDRGVDLLGDVFLVRQDDAAARATQALVRGGRDDVGVGQGIRVDARGDQAGIVGHVHHEVGADFLGDLAKALEVDAQRVGRGAGDDQLGLLLAGQGFHRVVVDGLIGVQAIADHVEPLAAHVQRHAVSQVPAFGQAHAHDGVAGLQQRKEHALVGLRAGIGLHVGEFGAEELLQTIDGQLLNHVHVLAAAVIALARVAFGVLVGELAALGLHDGRRGVVLAGDQLDMVFLAAVFVLDCRPEFRVDQGEGGGGAVKHGRCSEGQAVNARQAPLRRRASRLPRRTADGGRDAASRFPVVAHLGSACDPDRQSREWSV
mmetsp:Transcript_96733/g.269173  ORF Transcript_96733/g.269173 Transcript_96733/m.269173 type:complete len:376 (-) Transcript_96733:96-1223(-)